TPQVGGQRLKGIILRGPNRDISAVGGIDPVVDAAHRIEDFLVTSRMGCSQSIGQSDVFINLKIGSKICTQIVKSPVALMEGIEVLGKEFIAKSLINIEARGTGVIKNIGRRAHGPV